MKDKNYRRDVFLRKFKLGRSYIPKYLVGNNELIYTNIIELVVGHKLLEAGEFNFLQIGGYDGFENDIIRPLVLKYGLKGAIVEPQPLAFEKLKKTYAGVEGISILQRAISEKDGKEMFYSVAGCAVQQASFSKKHLIQHGIDQSEIVAQEVRCSSVMSLMEELNYENFDFIQIDAEGFDTDIIMSIDFDKVKPSVIRFEHAHIQDEALGKCINFLGSLGYRFISEKRDLIAVIQD